LNTQPTTFFTRKIFDIIPVIWILLFLVVPIITGIIITLFNLIFESNFSLLLFISDFYSLIISKSFLLVLISLISSVFAAFLGFYLSYFCVFLRRHLKIGIYLFIGLFFVINPLIHFQIINSFFVFLGYCDNYLVIILCLIFKYFPISFFLCLPALHNTNLDRIECSLDLGASYYFVFFKNVFLPCRYIIILGFGIIFLLCIGNVSIFISSPLSEKFAIQSIIHNYFFNHNIKYLGLLLIFFLAVTIIGIYFLNRFINKKKSYLFVNPHTHLIHYKCRQLGRSWLTIFINSSVLLFYFFCVIIVFIFSINLENYSELFSSHL